MNYRILITALLLLAAPFISWEGVGWPARVHSMEPVEINGAIAVKSVMHDISPPLSLLARVQNQKQAIVVEPASGAESNDDTVPESMAAVQLSPSIEQKEQGTRPPPDITESFDGLGEGFEGPQGSAMLRNPSDNSLAVGPDHIVQIVNTRMAVFTKKGSRFKTT